MGDELVAYRSPPRRIQSDGGASRSESRSARPGAIRKSVGREFYRWRRSDSRARSRSDSSRDFFAWARAQLRAATDARVRQSRPHAMAPIQRTLRRFSQSRFRALSERTRRKRDGAVLNMMRLLFG